MASTPTRQQMIVGRRLLARLLPAAIDAAKSDDLRAEPYSSLAKGMASHVTLDKFYSLAIYEGQLGGWHLDLVLRNMPPGFATVLGSPVATPYHSRQQAFEAAPMFLAMMVKLATQQKAPSTEPVFEFHGLVIKLFPAALEMLRDKGIQETGYDGETRLQKISEEMFPNGCTKEAWDILSHDAQAHLMSVIHCAAAIGITRYPSPEPAGPNFDTPFQGSFRRKTL
jgi:hypothetical protein